ncbi:hypothetical protein Q9966_015872 [Columba livia]|nr:hypothetical protein Q9966_015872 [Columba livia]
MSHIACAHLQAVVELLEHGADPNLPLSRAVGSALCAAVSTAYEQQRTAAQRIALVDKLLEAGANILAPVPLREGQTKAVGTAVDYAYFKYYQDTRIAHTPYHVLSASEQEVLQTRRSLLEHITVKLRECVILKEKEWDQEKLRRSKKYYHSSSTATSVAARSVFSCCRARVVTKSSPAVRPAEGTPGASSTGRSARGRWFHTMAERTPPNTPRVAWEEVEASQESSSLLDPCEATMVQPMQTDETLPEEKPELQPEWDAASTWSISSLDSSNMARVFAENHQPAQMTDILMVAIEALTAQDICDRQMGSRVLDRAMGDPASWLTDVPKLMRYIHKNMECVSTEPARHSLASLLLLLTERCPREVVRSLLEISPTCDSAALAMWEVMISMPGTLWSVLTELHSVLQDLRLSKVFSCATEDACICLLALLLRTDFAREKFAALYKGQSVLSHPMRAMLSLVLESLITLSEAPGMARKILVLLPDIMDAVQYASSDVKRKALVVCRNMTGHLGREEASPITLQLAESLLRLFDDESSLVRELSISLFRDVLETVVGRNKKMMRRTVKLVLLPLFLRMQDQSKSVAKASRDTLLACAEFLGWRKLSTLVQTHQTHRIGECLLQQDRDGPELQLCQSLLYVKDAQATVRLEAVRFIDLQPLTEDPDPCVKCLATQTLYNLLTEFRRPERSRWWLGCWICGSRRE